MCGRFHFGILPDKKGKQIKEKAQKLNLVYSEGEIFPTDDVLCIIPNESKIDLAVMKWGISSKSLLINARIENIDMRPPYKFYGVYELDDEKSTKHENVYKRVSDHIHISELQ